MARSDGVAVESSVGEAKQAMSVSSVTPQGALVAPGRSFTSSTLSSDMAKKASLSRQAGCSQVW